MLYRHISSRLWSSNIGSFNPTLSKGPLTTTWIWNLHASPHDFLMSSGYSSTLASINISRKVTSVGLAHLSVISFWIAGMLFHGAYFSNYLEWLRDPLHIKPSAHFVWSCVGQEMLNNDLGGYTQGIFISSGLFQIWRAQGFVSLFQLKASSFLVLFISCILMCLSFYIMHISPIRSDSQLSSFKNLIMLSGLASISWSAHIIHISTPLNRLLEIGVDPALISSAQDLLSRDVMRSIYPDFGQTTLVSFKPFAMNYSTTSISGSLLNGYLDSTGSIPLYISGYHHLYLGIVLVFSGLFIRTRSRARSLISESISNLTSSWHSQISIALLILASMSFIQSHNIFSTPVYPFIASDYPTILSLYCHHMWIGAFLMIGHGAHASIYLINDIKQHKMPTIISQLMAHRDVLVGHLIWVVIFLGIHSFGLYIHNDTMQALNRPQDSFSDSSLQLKPIFSTLAGFNLLTSETTLPSHIQALETRIYSCSLNLGTSDFMIHHIHAFTIHTTSLILVKGCLYSRSSRIVSDKSALGFRYPCDGPGRGGTCQISPWDHIFLSLFWMYNSISIVIFHFFWKMQADVWGSLSSTGGTLKVSHITSGDFSFNSNSINGWLRSYLWSQSSQVIQAYSTSISSYGLIFLGSHLIWAFSLMFLFSGRGYWQELIESLVWAHQKLKVVPAIQPRALSISQGRSVGVSHFILCNQCI